MRRRFTVRIGVNELCFKEEMVNRLRIHGLIVKKCLILSIFFT